MNNPRSRNIGGNVGLRVRRRQTIVLIGCMVFTGVGPIAMTAEIAGLQFAPANAPSVWTISYKGKPLLVYVCDPQKFKPYVKELRTLQGDNILRDAPFDHLHHHALMYGIKVNGINFWEETSGNGVQKPVESPEPVVGFAENAEGKLPQAKMFQVLHWVAPQDAFLPNSAPVALLVEHRTLLLTVSEGRHEIALEWKSQFEVGPKTNTVALTGANYHGLGMRFLQELDPLAEHSLSGMRPDLANNRQDVSASTWATVSFAQPGHPATVALVGHPSNARGDATYFSMLTPFAYLSATQGLDKEPLVYHGGDKWELNYLILLYPEAKPSETLRLRAESWRHSKP
ncbi:MAG TPA: DUF6807 family protein [Candidatus Limnocylindrales bacterium]|nr:DUF6807 family protein [Candidatus Limnocylindrales bacterium]